MEPSKGLPYFYATGLAKLLVGDQPCHLEAWLKGHFEIAKQPRSSNFAQWKVDHTALLQTEIEGLKSTGWTTTVERYFRVTGTAAIIGGKPDVIAQATGKRPKIVDVKSGKPRDSDVVQVLIYMITIPMAWKSPSMIFEGEVVYSTHRVAVKASEADALRPRLFELVRRLADLSTRPDASPSESACRFCDVTAEDCPVRFGEGQSVDVLTSEF